MAVTITSKTLYGPGQMLLRWSSNLSTPTYRIYIDGILTRITTMTWAYVPIRDGEYTQIEILDTTAAPEKAYPERMTLRWERVSGAVKYRIDKYVGSAWVTERTLIDNGATVCVYTTPVLDDGTAYRYRVVPVASNGVDGTAREWVWTMVRRPDADTVTTVYSAVSHKLTLTAA